MLRRSGFKRKTTKPMKRGTLKKNRVKVAGHPTVKDLKDDIQALLREIVMIRDKKCILYGIRCYNKIGVEGIVWQAEHLIERNNSETFADTRLVVLVCRNCHGWKHFTKSNHDQYDKWVKSKLSPERVKLWEACASRRFNSYRMGVYDWKLEIVNLKSELKELNKHITLIKE